MCNLYSITTNQEAIIALFRVINRCRQPRADTGRVSRLSGSSDPQLRRRTRNDDDAVGHATATAHRRATGHQYPQHIFAALARLAEA